MNPVLAPDQDYLDKVTALAANFPEQQEVWMNIRTDTEAARQRTAQIFQPKSRNGFSRIASALTWGGRQRSRTT
jgi:hypothetical protein